MSDTENIKTLNELAKQLDKATGKYLYGDGVVCSFCGKGQAQVEKMLASAEGNTFICNECVNSYQRILDAKGST